MKYFKILILLFWCSITFGQDFSSENRTVTGIFKSDGKTKADLYSSINKWVSINYNSAKNVIQLNDPNAGNIIIKGINQSPIRNLSNIIYPKNKMNPPYIPIKFNHLIEINIKDNRFRIKYTITDCILDVEDPYFCDCINFSEIDSHSLHSYKEHVDSSYKKWMVGKKKRELAKEQVKPIFDELNNRLVDDVKLTMLSIYKSTESETDDDW